MKNRFIKRCSAIVALLITGATVASAQDITSYFMSDVIESRYHNASFAPDRGYLNLPGIGGMSISANGNLSLDQIFKVNGDNLVPIIDTGISSSDALSGLNDINTMGFDSRFNIFGFGGYCKDKKSFWSFDISLRSSMSFSAPYELFEFAKVMPDNATIKDINIYMESYVETAFGYSRPIMKNLYVGVRVKLLGGLTNASLNIDRMDITTNADEWYVNAQGSLDINASGIAPEMSENDYGESIYNIDDIDGSIEGLAGFGGAIDVGASYSMFNDRIKLSASVNDVGFIKWNGDYNTSATIVNDYSFSGVDVEVSDGNTTVDDSSTSGSEIDDIEFMAQRSSDSTKWLQGNIKLGGEYNFFDNHIGIGAVYSANLWRAKTLHTLTGIATLRANPWLTVAGSYELASSGGSALGLALSVSPGFLNLYVATNLLVSEKAIDYLPMSQSAMNFSFGLSFSLAKGQRKVGL